MKLWSLSFTWILPAPARPPPRVGLGPKFPQKSGISVCPAPEVRARIGDFCQKSKKIAEKKTPRNFFFEASLHYDPFRRPWSMMIMPQYKRTTHFLCKKLKQVAMFDRWLKYFISGIPLNIFLWAMNITHDNFQPPNVNHKAWPPLILFQLLLLFINPLAFW